MTLVFTPDQDQFRDSIQRFLKDKMPTTEVRRLMATQRGFDDDLWQQASQQLALAGIHISADLGGAGFGALGFWCIMTMKLASVTPAPVSVTSSVSTLPLWIRTISGAGIFCVSESFARTSPMVEASSKSSSNFWLVLVTRNEAWGTGGQRRSAEVWTWESRSGLVDLVPTSASLFARG